MNWSGQALKLTMGIGTLAIVAVLSDLLVAYVGIYGMIVVVLIPFTLLVMIKPGELAPFWVRLAHLTAALGYTGLVLASLWVMVERGFIRSDLFMGALMALGFAPVFVVVKALKNRGYGAANHSQDVADDFDDDMDDFET